MLTGLSHIERVNAQRIAVAMGIGQSAHRLKVGHGDGGQDAVRHPGLCRAGSHLSRVWCEFGRIKVAVGIDPGQHQGKLPSFSHQYDTLSSLKGFRLIIF